MADEWFIADHRVLSRIGAGAYGEVWLAQNVMGALRAVKVVRRDRFENARTYEREFSGLQKFEPISRQHDGLVDILQIGRDDHAGFFYYIMELADPAVASVAALSAETYRPLTLQEKIRQAGRFSPGECARVGAQVAEALGFLHDRGLIHRDVKPSNIVYVGGHPKLVDVGLVARFGDARSFVGTEGYIAPEGPGTPQSDLFSLGKVLYEMATGNSRLDYPDIPADLHASEGERSFSELNEVILRACALDCAHRYASATELRGELLLLEAGRSVRQLRRSERLMSFWRRVGFAALILAAMVAVALIIERKRTDQARRTMESEMRLREAVEERVLVARQNLYAADMNLAQRALDDGNYGRAEELLSTYRTPSGQPEVRGIEWYHLWHRLKGDSLVVLRGHGDVVSSLLLTPDGQRMFSASFDTTVREWDLTSYRELRHWSMPGCLFMSLASDRAWTKLAGEGGNRAFSCLLDLENGTWVTRISSASPCVAFAPDGASVLRGSQSMLFETNGLIEVTDLAFRVKHVLPESGSRVVFAPDGRNLATGPWADNIRLWTWPELQPRGLLSGAGTVLSMSFSPDGRRLAAGTREGLLVLWDTQSGRRIAEAKAHGGNVVWSVSFSPDGERLASGGNDQTVRVWTADPLAETQLYRGHGGEVWSVVWAENAERLLSGGKDATIRVWPGRADKVVLEVKEVAQAPVFTPDDRWLAVRTRDGSGIIYETATGREVGKINSVLEIGAVGVSGDELTIITTEGTAEKRSLPDLRQVLRRKPLGIDPDQIQRRLLSRDGRWFAVGARNGEVRVHALWTDEEVTTLGEHDGMIVSLAISPDGKWLLSGSIDRTARLWDLERRALRHTFSGHRMGIGAVAFSADGSRIATGSWDDSIQVWDGANHQQVAWLRGHQSGVQAVAFAPDRRSLLAITGRSVLTFWSLASGREAGTLALGSGTGQSWLTISSSGRWIAAVGQSEILRLIPAPRDE